MCASFPRPAPSAGSVPTRTGSRPARRRSRRSVAWETVEERAPRGPRSGTQRSRPPYADAAGPDPVPGGGPHLTPDEPRADHGLHAGRQLKRDGALEGRTRSREFEVPEMGWKVVSTAKHSCDALSQRETVQAELSDRRAPAAPRVRRARDGGRVPLRVLHGLGRRAADPHRPLPAPDARRGLARDDADRPARAQAADAARAPCAGRAPARR